jgi:hypothetical protein
VDCCASAPRDWRHEGEIDSKVDILSYMYSMRMGGVDLESSKNRDDAEGIPVNRQLGTILLRSEGRISTRALANHKARILTRVDVNCLHRRDKSGSRRVVSPTIW